MSKAYEMVIGLETHWSCARGASVFCACPNVFGAEPQHAMYAPCAWACRGRCRCSTRRCCAMRAMAGMALGCHVHHRSRFEPARITSIPTCPQARIRSASFYRPLCEGGALTIQSQPGRKKRVGSHPHPYRGGRQASFCMTRQTARRAGHEPLRRPADRDRIRAGYPLRRGSGGLPAQRCGPFSPIRA